MSSQIFTIHYPTLEKALEEQDIKNPDRTKSYLDIMKDNFSKNAFEVLQWDTAVLEVNHDKLDVTILWEELQWKYYGIPNSNLEQDEQTILYDNIMNAIEQAKDLSRYDDIFKEIHPK